MVVVEIVQMYLLFLKVINNAAIVKIFSNKASLFDQDMNIIDDIECINDFSPWQRTKPVTRMYFAVTEFSFRTQTLAIYPIVDQCESIGGSKSVM